MKGKPSGSAPKRNPPSKSGTGTSPGYGTGTGYGGAAKSPRRVIPKTKR